MIFCGIGNLERFFFHEKDCLEERHWIDVAMSEDEPTFAVTNCCDDEWIWEFFYDKTNYELIKCAIMDCIMGCDTMDELIEALDEVFECEFSDIVVCDECYCQGCEEELFDDEDEDDDSEDEELFDCDGDCKTCECRKTCVE